MPSVLYLGNSAVIRLTGLRNRDGDLVSDATVNLTELADVDGNTPAGITLPLLLAPTSGGNYEAQVPPLYDIEVNNLYARVVAVSPAAAVGEFLERCMVRDRST